MDITGTPNNDLLLTGTADNDAIAGLAGNDALFGEAGDRPYFNATQFYCPEVSRDS